MRAASALLDSSGAVRLHFPCDTTLAPAGGTEQAFSCGILLAATPSMPWLPEMVRAGGDRTLLLTRTLLLPLAF